MQVREITKKALWKNFLKECKQKTFLQSWNWGEFNKRMGNKIWRLGIFENDKLLGIGLVLKVKAKRGTFLLLPHGPLLPCSRSAKEKRLKTLLKKLKRIARKEKASFVRIAPIWERNKENRQLFENLGFREAPIHVHPELTWVLDITPSERDLLMQMRKTTRYLIRKAMKNKDLKVIKSQELEAVKNFHRLYERTASREEFVPFSLDYLKNEFLSFALDDQVLALLVKYKEELLSSAILIFWQNIAFYHQGASIRKYPKIPTNYLLQWEVIREAKKRGCNFYNFWGIAESGLKDKSHPWWGLTMFKMGFGGEREEYVKTQDLPLSLKYWPTFVFEILRRKKRGF